MTLIVLNNIIIFIVLIWGQTLPAGMIDILMPPADALKMGGST